MTLHNSPMGLSTAEPTVRVAPSYTFKKGLNSQKQMAGEWIELIQGPGDGLNLSSGKKFREIRDRLDADQPYLGLHAQSGQTPRAEDVKNPDSPNGAWDPLQFMPRFAFDAQEDAFPVAPDFDGEQDYNNNAPTAANGAGGSYQDGVIGGRQALNGAFTVTKKGEYHVLTYSFYSAHNKAGSYHANDYSTAQIYLKPGADGKLQPTHLATSWHHGSVLTPWKDLAKDAQGRPVVQVHRGSHALQALGRGETLPKNGVQIAGDGSVTHNGKPLPHRLGFEAFQTNVTGATYKDPAHPSSAARLNAMRWGEAAMNPFLPEVYDNARHPVLELTVRAFNGLKSVAGNALDKVGGEAKELKDKGVKLLKKLPFV